MNTIIHFNSAATILQDRVQSSRETLAPGRYGGNLKSVNFRWLGSVKTPSRYMNKSWASSPQCVNTLRSRKSRCHFTDYIFKCIFFNENVWILNKFSLKFVPQGSITNIPALIQIMAWCRPGNKPLSILMMVTLLMQICITLPQWVKERQAEGRLYFDNSSTINIRFLKIVYIH